MKRLVLLSLAASFILLPACDGDDEPTNGGGGGTPAAIAVVSGSGQRVAVGRAALGPLRVRVTDSQNRGVASQQVNWAVAAGGGSVSSASSTTNSNGEASVVLTAGSSAGDNAVSATVQSFNLPAATFTVQGVVATTLTKVSGDDPQQMGRISQPLAEPFVVRVTAGDGLPAPNFPVSWQVTGGGGSLSASSSNTDAAGQASIILTLGSMPGGNSASATATGLAVVNFDATGTMPVTVQMDMQNIAFVAPRGGDAITILLGDAVRWVNLDGEPHTATSTSTPTGGTAFDSRTLNQNDAYTYVPDARGAWVYFCELHPTIMRDARITVE